MINDHLTRRFFQYDPDNLTDTEILELLLRFSADTNAAGLAERLMKTYPNIALLMEADKKALTCIEGMDEDSLLLLRLIPELNRRYFLAFAREEKHLLTGSDFGQYLLPLFHGKQEEMVYLLMLDAAGGVLGCPLIGHGSVNSANVPLRRMVQEVLSCNASSVVLAHNHPSRVALPSREDVDLTFRLRDILAPLEVDLIDHIVVADNDYVSFRDSGYFRRF